MARVRGLGFDTCILFQIFSFTCSLGDLPLLEDNEIERMYRIYDVVAEDNNNGNETSLSDDQLISNDEKILCNNVEMIRENFHIGSGKLVFILLNSCM